MNIVRDSWNVQQIEIGVARNFVRRYHYAHNGANTAVACYGLFKDGSEELHGISWWMPPAYGAARYVSENDHKNVLTLSRFCLVEDRPENSGSFLIAKSIKMLPKRWNNLVTYADTALNHDGGLYRASNWSYDGMTGLNPLFRDPKTDMLVSRKKGPKTYSRSQMVEKGFEYLGSFRKHRYLYPRYNRKGVVINSRKSDEIIFTHDGKIITPINNKQ